VSIFLEIGPKTVLTGLVKSILKDQNITAISMDASPGNKPGSGLSDLAHILANLASKGCNVDLTKWENSCKKAEKKKMNIFLTGANPKPSGKCDLPPSKIIKPSQGNDMKKEPIITKENNSPITVQSPQMPNEAMALIHKGLESMQQLQSQTAKTHEKFLETQAEASRALQSMMDQTKLFASNIITPHSPADIETEKPLQNTYTPVPTEEIADNIEIQTPAQITTDDIDEPAKNNIKQTEDLVFKIVSKLTGFPEEMLESDMDIESDLGIDSIKRVEIISELEKSLPSVSSLTSETMGCLRTLKEICQVVDKNNISATEISNSSTDASLTDIIKEKNPEYSQASSAGSPSLKLLITTISNLTGFPEEMLEGEMDLESDLGVDSIKRVEILSTLEKGLPQIGSISSDEIAGFKTIDEISAYLDNSLIQKPEPKPKQREDSLQTTFIEPAQKKKFKQPKNCPGNFLFLNNTLLTK
ncbi:MAG: hypothetical protein K8R67_04065, partial [Desulfobacteraceae bacterium]|nr:hypothetical protein [Desulfobacteraceae bacterium]